MPLILAAHGWEAEILPALGGAVARLSHQGRELLRRSAAGVSDPLETGCFPLVPYANRIAGGRFGFAGEEQRVRLNFGAHPHSLHGVGWQRGWAVTEQASDHVMLVHEHRGDADWPWDYRAEQELLVDAHGLRMTLSVRNDSAGPMPAGLGFHPYFPVSPEARLQIATGKVWLGDAEMLPVAPAPADHFGDFAAGAPIARDGLIDNAYAGWDGHAVLTDGDRATLIEAEGARAVHLFVPPGAGFCCIEPVTHLPDALNRPDFAIDILTPSETLSLTMRIGEGRISDCVAGSASQRRDI